MSKIEKYKCDICGKEVNSPYMKVRLPMPYFAASDWQMGHNKTDSLSTFTGDACKSCCKRISQAIEKSCEKYGEYAYAGKFIKWRLH